MERKKTEREREREKYKTPKLSDRLHTSIIPNNIGERKERKKKKRKEKSREFSPLWLYIGFLFILYTRALTRVVSYLSM